MATFPATQSVSATSCSNCGIVFLVRSDWLRERQASGTNLWCPNGHVLAYRETEIMKLKKQVETAEASLVEARRRVEFEANGRRIAEGQEAAQRKKRLRLEKRARGGACPCCKRTIGQLARHMATKHPDFSATGKP